MEAFIVIDAMIMGKGVFGIFSCPENAICFKEEFEKETRYFCEVKQFSVIGTNEIINTVYAAYTYDMLYDTHIFDGLYAKPELAFDAVGEKGLVIEFIIDSPEKENIKSIH